MRVINPDHRLIAHKLTYLRDQRTDSPTFRRLAEELMTLLAYEATRDVRVEPFEIETPVAPTTGIKLSNPKPLIVPILRAGLASQLRPRPEVKVIDAPEPGRTSVALVVADRVAEPTLRTLRSLQRVGARLVLVVAELDDADLVAAVEAGVAGVVRRAEASPDRLINVVQAAAVGDGALPPDLLGRLLSQVGKLQRQVLWPRGLTFGGRVGFVAMAALAAGVFIHVPYWNWYGFSTAYTLVQMAELVVGGLLSGIVIAWATKPVGAP